jgi:hypothetical protein
MKTLWAAILAGVAFLGLMAFAVTVPPNLDALFNSCAAPFLLLGLCWWNFLRAAQRPAWTLFLAALLAYAYWTVALWAAAWAYGRGPYESQIGIVIAVWGSFSLMALAVLYVAAWFFVWQRKKSP